MSEKPTMRQYRMDRDRGILTESDREFLKDRKELSDQAKRDARYRIRNRVEDGVLDLAYLSIFLSEEDRNQVANKVFPNSDEGRDALANSLRFLFQLFLDNLEDTSQDELSNFIKLLENIAESELNEGSENKFVNVELDAEYNERLADEEELLKKYEEDQESYREFIYLKENSLIQPGTEYWRHQFRHAWEQGLSFNFPSMEGESIEHNPSNYDNRSKFIEQGIDLIKRITDDEYSEES